MTFQITTRQPIEDLAQKVPAACATGNFSVMHSYNFQEILEGKGFPIARKAMVFEICQARIASKMLTLFPEFSVFMPCRISLYEENGQTVISTMDMVPLLALLEGNPEFLEEASAMFENLKALMQRLTKD
jgi:uncharacterized protein (DUF302 family)